MENACDFVTPVKRTSNYIPDWYVSVWLYVFGLQKAIRKRLKQKVICLSMYDLLLPPDIEKSIHLIFDTKFRDYP